jgi:mannose-6-phosphate isomerase-like protein (cupin superfamily)
MRRRAVSVTATILLVGCSAALAVAQNPPAGGPAGAPPAPPAPTDKAMFFSGAENQNIWKDLEARQVINKRVMEGGTYSINIRIVKTDSPPLVHAKSIDLWIVQEGTATAITGGELLNPKKGGQGDDTSGTDIRGGVEQPLKPGDMIFIPTGVPHGFKDLKGFRAFLIRWEPKTP